MITAEMLRQSEAAYCTKTDFKDATSCSLSSNTGAAPL
ncbi:unnamed protein product [Ixodes pacificus]